MSSVITYISIQIEITDNIIDVEVSKPHGGSPENRRYAYQLSLGSRYLIDRKPSKIFKAGADYIWAVREAYDLSPLDPTDEEKAASAAFWERSLRDRALEAASKPIKDIAVDDETDHEAFKTITEAESDSTSDDNLKIVH